MTIPANLSRVSARRLLLQAISDRVVDEDTAVLYRYPANHPARKVIAGGDVEGTVEVRTIRPGRVSRRDSFDLQVFCVAGPNSTELDQSDPLDPGGFESLDVVVLELVQIVDDVVADNPRLGDNGGLVATLGSIEGPNATEHHEGPGSAAVVTVHFESHHH